MTDQPLLRSLRDTRVLAVHPADQDGEELVRHLRRIGCQVSQAWPPPARIPGGTEVVFHLIDRARPPFLDAAAPGPFAVVGIIEYEDPAVLRQLITVNARGVVVKPVRPFGILGTLVTARAAQRYEAQLVQKAEKLNENLRVRRELEKSVRILMDEQGLGEAEAYELIRRQAMDQRQPLATIASSIVFAHGALRRSRPSPPS
ncbi:Aliphatic amidase regulator [Methylobacterium crusticola]|uniref:Aliphatic amidase regulator n=1 Tax=Methylobacterium crusticola TaxID=1697972 RepID=A0ABQ4R620_9HYPH|nr:ANTAR domain-containing protein [Methylobacterium crusticola]GJD52207.1 Aliphatic amidase regulator [Methylobacterium crusticola]